MSSDSANDILTMMGVDERLFRAIVASVQDALAMCGREARCVGVSSVTPGEAGTVTAMIGVHGNVTGFVVVNMTDLVAMKTVGGLLQEEFEKISVQVVDGIGEIANMIAGSIKARIAKTEYAFGQITVPSVIVGRGYQVAFGKGSNFLTVSFEHKDDQTFSADDRLLRVSLSLIKL